MRPLLAGAFFSLTLWSAPSSADDDATGRVRGIDAAVGDAVALRLGDGKWTQLGSDVAVLRNSRITQIVPSARVASPAR